MVHVLSLVSYQFLPPRAGGQRAIALLNKYLFARVPLTCVTTVRNHPAASPGYPVMNILSASSLRYINPFYFFTLRNIIQQKGITHLLVEHPYYGWLGVLLQRATGVQLIVRSHNIEGLRWKGLGKWWWKVLWHYEKWVHRQARFNFFIQENDLQYAIQHFKLKPEKCLLVTYGIEWNSSPAASEKQRAREYLCREHGIPADHTILLFNGVFDYPPNLLALQQLITEINPLLQQIPLRYTLLICGMNIPEQIASQKIPNTIIAGFVQQIDPYFKGADIFVNPITEGGGIKTKLVEALGSGMNAVSVQQGAVGISPALCGGKLIVTGDKDWEAFAAAVVQLAGNETPMPAGFYEHFYWGNIAEQAVTYIQT